MRRFLWRLLVFLAVCAGLVAGSNSVDLSGPGSALAHPKKSSSRAAVSRAHAQRHSSGNSRLQHAWSVDARRGVAELLGRGDGSPVGWNRHFAQWGGLVGPHWWQSALAMLTLMHYAEHTNDRSRTLQHVLLVTYRKNIYKPHSDEKRDFANQYMDDTVWWGLAWLEASQYELYYRQDRRAAAKFLAVAEWDARYVAARRRCGGIVWQLGSPPGTITMAEYVALASELSQYRRTSSAFHDPARAARWAARARGALHWLERTHLVNMKAGTIKDRLASGGCHRLLGAPLAYSQGEVADALVRMGNALNDPAYYRTAARFLRYVLKPANGFVVHGILQEHCEADALCTHNLNRYDITAFKGIFVQSVADWSIATGSREFMPFLRRQASAVIHNSLPSRAAGTGVCPNPHSCQFAFSWGRPASQTPSDERLVTVGTQESALAALIAVLP